MRAFYRQPDSGRFQPQRTSSEPDLRTVPLFRQIFEAEFLRLWETRDETGDIAPPILSGHSGRNGFITSYLQKIHDDTTGFAALEIIRRLTGYAQTSYFSHLPDHEGVKRQQEALSCATALLTGTGGLPG
ncbi:hypothetical protein LOC54_11530 [Acetobacter sp. AN02]|uniref:hypothetical protein n=1 Tax=Acetobacter sp. AN02 TaxID=2894186 RepID=UPI0024341FA0|nr:hypothetical protein [Acetobacter sp. AN02]MDG6095705.1 hypothetical protein [Acetobacter sp. AN02]